jgi:hypothetical protein
MTRSTWTELLEADPEPFHRAAAAWAALAAGADRAYQAYQRALPEVERGWAEGAGAEAAARRLVEPARDLSDAPSPLRNIAEALTRHAYGTGELRQHAQRFLEGAQRSGSDIAATRPDTAALGRELAELVRRLHLLDEETAAAIRSNRPPGSAAFTDSRDAVLSLREHTPAQVHAWWRSLSPEQREHVVRAYPDLVGGLDGVPALDRDRANRSILDTQLAALPAREADLAGQLDRAQRTALAAAPLLAIAPIVPAAAPIALAAAAQVDAVRRQLAEVRNTEAGLRTVAAQLVRYGGQALLLGIDGAGDGRAIVALGNPDTAQHTAVFIPGMNTDLFDLGGDLHRVDNLHREASRLAPAGEGVAGIYWLGYDAPGTLDALGHSAAVVGSRDLTSFVDGLRATHESTDGPHHVTAVGHSYGSTVVAESALAGGLRVDDIITAGSPGMHTDRAANLNLDPRHVWGGLAAGDAVGGSLGELRFVHGEEPSDPAFGANRYSVDTRGHGAYWAENSASLRNQAYIVVARYDRVGYEFGAPPPS